MKVSSSWGFVVGAEVGVRDAKVWARRVMAAVRSLGGRFSSGASSRLLNDITLGGDEPGVVGWSKAKLEEA